MNRPRWWMQLFWFHLSLFTIFYSRTRATTLGAACFWMVSPLCCQTTTGINQHFRFKYTNIPRQNFHRICLRFSFSSSDTFFLCFSSSVSTLWWSSNCWIRWNFVCFLIRLIMSYCLQRKTATHQTLRFTCLQSKILQCKMLLYFQVSSFTFIQVMRVSCIILCQEHISEFSEVLVIFEYLWSHNTTSLHPSLVLIFKFSCVRHLLEELAPTQTKPRRELWSWWPLLSWCSHCLGSHSRSAESSSRQ